MKSRHMSSLMRKTNDTVRYNLPTGSVDIAGDPQIALQASTTTRVIVITSDRRQIIADINFLPSVDIAALRAVRRLVWPWPTTRRVDALSAEVRTLYSIFFFLSSFLFPHFPTEKPTASINCRTADVSVVILSAAIDNHVKTRARSPPTACNLITHRRDKTNR